MSKEKGKKKYDMHTLLKNPSSIVSDSVKNACETLWTTIKMRVLYKYNIASEDTRKILEWITLNLKFLAEMVEIQ